MLLLPHQEKRADVVASFVYHFTSKAQFGCHLSYSLGVAFRLVMPCLMFWAASTHLMHFEP